MSVEGDYDEREEDDDDDNYELKVKESAFDDLWDCAIPCGQHHCNLLFNSANGDRIIILLFKMKIIFYFKVGMWMGRWSSIFYFCEDKHVACNSEGDTCGEDKYHGHATLTMMFMTILMNAIMTSEMM